MEYKNVTYIEELLKWVTRGTASLQMKQKKPTGIEGLTILFRVHSET